MKGLEMVTARSAVAKRRSEIKVAFKGNDAYQLQLFQRISYSHGTWDGKGPPDTGVMFRVLLYRHTPVFLKWKSYQNSAGVHSGVEGDDRFDRLAMASEAYIRLANEFLARFSKDEGERAAAAKRIPGDDQIRLEPDVFMALTMHRQYQEMLALWEKESMISMTLTPSEKAHEYTLAFGRTDAST